MATALLYLAVAVGTLVVIRWPGRSPTPVPRGISAVVLVLLPMALVGPAMLTGRIYAPLDLAFDYEPVRAVAPDGFAAPHATSALDVALQIVPWHAAVRASWSAGDWPLWNPSMLAGDTLAASAQAAPYHPLNLLALLLPLGAACTFLAASSLFIAALGTFLWLRELDCAETPALIGGTAFALSGFVVFWLLWPMGLTATHLPWVLYAVTRLVRWNDFTSSLFLAVALALTMLAGHPETALHVVLAGCAVGIFELILKARRDGARTAGAPTIRAVAAGLAALGLSAIFLLPIVDALEQSAQFEGRQAGFADADHSLPVRKAVARARTAAMPFVYGLPWRDAPPNGDPWFVPASSAYIGAVMLPFVLLAIARSTSPRRFFLLGMALFGITAGASFPGVTEMLASIPLVNLAIHKRWVMVGAVGLAGLAGLGADTILRARDRQTVFLAHAATFTVLALGLAVSRPAMLSRLPTEFIWTQGAWLLVPVALAGAALQRWPGRRGLWLCLALLFLQRIGEAGDRYPALDPSWVYPEVPILEAIPQPTAGSPGGRFIATGDLLPPNLASVYGLEDVRGYQPLSLGRYVDTLPWWTDRGDAWFYRVDHLAAHQSWLDLLGVRWALTDGAVPAGWQPIASTTTAEGQALHLIENPHALPRAFAPRTVHLDAPEIQRRRALQRRGDLSQIGWIERLPAAEPERLDNPSGSIEVTARGSTRVLTTQFADPAWVVITEPAWRGWRAHLAAADGGRELPVHRAQHAFLAIQVPAGEHGIVLRYEPRSFVVGRWATFSTLLGLLALSAFGWRRRW